MKRDFARFGGGGERGRYIGSRDGSETGSVMGGEVKQESRSNIDASLTPKLRDKEKQRTPGVVPWT